MFNEDESRREAECELERGERLLWVGQPDPKLQMQKSMNVFIFAVPFTTVALLLTTYSWATRNVGAHPLTTTIPWIGLTITLMGASLLTAPLWAKLRAKLTTYAITSQRVMLIEVGAERRVRSIQATEIAKVQRIDLPDDKANIVIVPRGTVDPLNLSSREPIRFQGVADPDTAEEIMRTSYRLEAALAE